MSWYVDTSVLLAAVGGEHPQRDPCRRFLQSVQRGPSLHANVEAVQEFMFHRLRRTDRRTALQQTRGLIPTLTLHPFGPEALHAALALVEATHLRGRDAAHVAIGQAHGFDHIVSLDADFDGVPGFRRIHPADVP